MEVEIKIKLDNAEEVKQKAESLGAKKIQEGLLHDVYYDDGKGFFENGGTLRIRTGLEKALLTYKECPVDHNAHVISRPEIQTNVDDPEKLHQILEKLGFKPHVVKEKKILDYQFHDVVLEFHTLPFLGEFLEIEASEDKLKEILPKLNLNLEQGLSQGYNKLFKEYKKLHNIQDSVQDTFEQASKYLNKKGQ